MFEQEGLRLIVKSKGSEHRSALFNIEDIIDYLDIDYKFSIKETEDAGWVYVIEDEMKILSKNKISSLCQLKRVLYLKVENPFLSFEKT